MHVLFQSKVQEKKNIQLLEMGDTLSKRIIQLDWKMSPSCKMENRVEKLIKDRRYLTMKKRTV